MNDRTLHVLVLSAFDGTNANVIRDFLFSFRAHSRHRYFYVFDCRILDDDFDLSAFDVILVFWSVYLLGPDLGPRARERIRSAAAVKVLFLQDEYRDVFAANERMRELGVQLMFTCVAEKDHETFYPRSRIPTLDAVYTVLPGYVPAYLEEARPDPVRPRPLDVSYRSREVPVHLGDLAQEKRIVAERFRVICRDHDLTADISIREADRLYGESWVRFLLDSRCVLGTASGASVIDFTGDVRRRCVQHLATHPEASYEEVKRLCFADVDGRHVIDTVSPRVFEAAALHCTMVHHEGGYAGILEPGRHYVRVARDYSNVAEVVEQIRDRGHCREIADNAHRDLVASGRYGYREFVRTFDARLEAHVPRRRRRRTTSPLRFYGRNYLRRGQGILPLGDGFRIAPSPALVSRSLHAWLARIPTSRRGWLATGLLLNPRDYSRKVLLAAALVASTAALRTILRVHLRLAGRTRVPIWMIADDLMRLHLLGRAAAGVLRSHPSFSVEITREAAETLLVRSIPASPAPTSVAEAVGRLVLEGRLESVVWDHSAIGEDLGCELVTGRWLRIHLDGAGLHRFDALLAAYRSDPERVGPALLETLAGRSVPSVRIAPDGAER